MNKSKGFIKQSNIIIISLSPRLLMKYTIHFFYGSLKKNTLYEKNYLIFQNLGI